MEVDLNHHGVSCRLCCVFLNSYQFFLGSSWCLSISFSHEAHTLILPSVWSCQTLTSLIHNTQKHDSSLPMPLYIGIFTYIFPLQSLMAFFSLDRKMPQVFLVGNSCRGMLLCEQGAWVESRFSGSSPTPCSAIPSRARCHDQHRVRTCSKS